VSHPKESPPEAVKARIRAAGLRCTTARLAVMQHLDTAVGPRTHAEVSEALTHRGFDRATIYRNLTELTEAKLVTRVELGDHVWRFEIKRPGHHGAVAEDHPHFVCTTCGEISCLDDVRVAITPAPRTRGQAGRGKKTPGRQADGGAGIHSVTEVLLKGRCGDCG
jgi:Fur family ferric uptake transcriptional regulator